jgi:hypothetical protein
VIGGSDRHLQAFIGSEEHAQVLVFLDRALLEKQAIAPETEVVDELFLQLACELDEIRHLLLHLLDFIYGYHYLHLIPQVLTGCGQLELQFHLILKPSFQFSSFNF